MKKLKLIIIIAILSLGSSALFAQTPTSSIAKGLGIYVFPANEQTQETQDADEMACYKWAKEQTGVDPMNPPKAEAAPADQSLDGSAVRGAAKGAAAGAAIGAIGGDAGEGAAIGAVVGGLAGRRARKAGDQAEQKQNQQAAAAYEKDMMDKYIKAFSVCMEGKGYSVK